MTVISLRDVTLERQGKYLLTNLNWQVQKGETWAILGLNGSGKSTLLKLIMAEFFPSKGQASVLGATFGKGDISHIRHHIGVVSSFISERLSPHMLAEQIVLTGQYKSSILYKSYTQTELEEARQMLDNLGASHLIGHYYASLSQGEKQLLLIARSLMDKPRLLILDEATTGLDLFARDKLLRQIDTISELENAPTILFVTHHPDEITTKMTHLLLLREGKIVAQGPKESILTKKQLEAFYQRPVHLISLDEGRFFIQPR
ncbi:ABC transporter ATP-binding protein [Streptococcus sp. zg-JUN1979]|uniref:ABC transporter ATP-binding protein n=1 Tax=Streptococcus sp. zg-JUN1979 TaxID=3391450 RepID=UPI0039A7369B